MDYATFTSDPIIQSAGFANTAKYTQALVEQQITDVACLLPESRFAASCTGCDRHELAIKYLTAHRLTVLAQTGIIGGSTSNQASGLITGPISSISASQGSQSLSFSQASGPTTGAGWLAEGQTPTYWWALFQGIMNTRKIAMGFTV